MFLRRASGTIVAVDRLDRRTGWPEASKSDTGVSIGRACCVLGGGLKLVAMADALVT